MLTKRKFAPTVEAMVTLNKYARDIAAEADVNACTDITGFGLAGHACEMARGSGKTIVLSAGALPLLPYALEMAEKDMAPGGTERNRAFFGPFLVTGGSLPPPYLDILYDPQTSGGLLLAVVEADARGLLEKLKAVCPGAAIVGRVTEFDGAPVRVAP